MAASATPKSANGDSATEETVTTYEQAADGAARLVLEARLQVDILTRDFDPRIYDKAPFVDAVSRLIRERPRRAAVRVLVKEPQQAAQGSHRLLELAQRLPSFITIHQPMPEAEDFIDALLLVDGTGFLYREQGDRPLGRLATRDLPRASELALRFERLWHLSTPDPHSRRLSL